LASSSPRGLPLRPVAPSAGQASHRRSCVGQGRMAAAAASLQRHAHSNLSPVTCREGSRFGRQTTRRARPKRLPQPPSPPLPGSSRDPKKSANQGPSAREEPVGLRGSSASEAVRPVDFASRIYRVRAPPSPSRGRRDQTRARPRSLRPCAQPARVTRAALRDPFRVTPRTGPARQRRRPPSIPNRWAGPRSRASAASADRVRHDSPARPRKGWPVPFATPCPR
jgi:hypothetical protein